MASNIQVDEVVKGLIKIVTDILNPTFKVADIYNREKRKQYIDNFENSQKPDLTKEEPVQWNFQDIVNSDGNIPQNEDKSINKKDTSKKNKQRINLIPKSLALHIENPKINKIFEELKHIQVKTCPNASSVLLRVFLELSVDAYLEKYNLVVNNALTASSSKESLQGKVGKVLNHMTQQGTMNNDISKGIRAEINDKNSVLSIESLNAYVHNEFFYPKADNLIVGWVPRHLLVGAVSWFVRNFMEQRYLLGVVRRFVSLMGTDPFIPIIKSAERTNPMMLRVSRKKEGS